MYFLSTTESLLWKSSFQQISAGNLSPDKFSFENIHPNLISCFHYFTGSNLATVGQSDLAMQWLSEGALLEDNTQMMNAFLLAFLKRHGGKLIKPAAVFSDPAPYNHFTSLPVMKQSRINFLKHCTHCLPGYKKPISVMDIGCGNGVLTIEFVNNILTNNIAPDIKEILLIDSSMGMINLSKEVVSKAFPNVKINCLVNRIENLTDSISGHYEIALSSLAYHHMPYEAKLFHLKKLSHLIENFILFEINANNDSPEMQSPELACSNYQSYGRLIDFIFSHDAPVETAVKSVDDFLMVELVSFLTEKRGLRSDYHMLRHQWHNIFKEGLGPDFRCLGDSTPYADEYMEMMTIHYGK